MRVSTVSKLIGTLAVAGSLSACASGPVVTSLPINHMARDNERIAGYYALPRVFYPLTLKRDKKDAIEVEFGAAAYVPDTSKYYAIGYITDGASSDQITVETDGLGLLKSVAPKSTDATGDIVKKVIELASAAAKLASTLEATTPTQKCAIGVVNKQFVIDPGDSNWRDVADEIRTQTCFEITVKPLGGKIVGSSPVGCDGNATDGCADGIFYRPAVPYRVTVTDLRKGSARTFIAMAPSAETTLVATLDRRAITGLNTTLTFSNGMLTKFESTDPNQAVAALQIPIDALTAIAAIPGEVLKVKVTHANDEKAYLDAQRTLLDAQKQLADSIKAQQDAARNNKP